jgi:multicomponent Na+:H+ antiporter subunit C
MTLLVAATTAWLFLIGLVGIAISRNVIQIVGCIAVAKSATAVLLIAIGYREDGVAPIRDEEDLAERVVDPLTQALTMIDIIVGATITALLLALAVEFHRRKGTLDPGSLFSRPQRRR